ncbi:MULTISPECIES: hypothetical protein [Prochlorococcus]|uniref:hypothetical protein n=1 Tax=Prochlorococcus TaxID=1218 RepID=UPI0007BB02D7|nr:MULTISPECIES: hypothetical protein [Prochlorococcus]KZR62803.1 hypothetical protein PMIT1312_02273 [Prochlorococcus marinus str. MIT 1312]NMO85143.1 hypothetical protein [Prochlorococcus sp. P1344]NMP07124.1 hypothetical protein [Prochlorococcus sp. P1361]
MGARSYSVCRIVCICDASGGGVQTQGPTADQAVGPSPRIRPADRAAGGGARLLGELRAAVAHGN